MKDKFGFIDKEMNQIKKNHLHRILTFAKSSGSQIIIKDKKLLNLCSNDYLGIPPKKLQIKQMQSSSRLVSGNDENFRRLEEKLAKHKSQKGSLVYPNGYMANLGTISAMTKKGDIILSDKLNHASIIESCKLSDAKVSIFNHNDPDDLEKRLREKANNKFVITEGVFSMDGDLSKLDQITEVAQKANAITILDDAHGDFVLGKDGKGTANQFGVSKKVDVYISSLSKGLGSFGGYIAAEKKIVDFCINKSKSFIYTSALPSFLVDYSINRIEMNREKYRKKLFSNKNALLEGLKQIGYDIKSESHIIPIIIGNEKNAMEFGKYIFKNGIFAQPIRYPTVPKNQARIRITVTAWLSKKEIEFTLDVFERAANRFL